MRTGLDFKSEGEAEDWVKGLGQGEAEGLGQNARTWNLVQSEDFKGHLIRINQYLKWGELILIQSKD
jgi:hypothetical protein